MSPALPSGARAYLVGGAVRDHLLGQPVSDRDWVVVGTTAQAMRESGFEPVGRDFPVFLHPQSHEEYALARTERKTSAGYHGFVFHAAADVTLEEDLARRDLTVNAMARDDNGGLIDPYGGERDLREGVLRHVSAAFQEDPVRILRLARFAARWPSFSVAPETMALCRAMVAEGEVKALVSERVWQELSKGLMEVRPSRMLAVLRDTGALEVLAPEINRLWGVPQPQAHHPEVDTGVHLGLVLDQCAVLGASLPARFAALVHDLGKGLTPPANWPRHLGHEQGSVRLARTLAARWKVPTACLELAQVVAAEHGHIHASATLGPAALLRLLERCDALRRPDRWPEVLLACEADARGRAGLQDRPYPQRVHLMQALEVALNVDTASAAALAQGRGARGSAIGEAVRQQRILALEAWGGCRATSSGTQAPMS